MSLHIYTHTSKEKLKLNPKPFASGGEGSLYKIIAPRQLSNAVVKLYHPNKITATKEEKIKYLLKHPPQNNQQQSIVWIQDIVTDKQGNFLGFVMPLVKGEKLEILCSTKLPKKLANTWYRFHKDAPDALSLRLKICYNLAAAIHQIHACERYVLVDLKPDNVLINPEGLVSLVDLDSVEVVENGCKIFDAPVATPEYTPPEYYQKNNTHDPTQQQAWDRFSMAVIFYKLIMGIHPFAGSFHKPYHDASTLAQKIKHGLFVHNPNIAKYQKTIPPPHQYFFSLGQELQELFQHSFVAGHGQPALRPTAHTWCSTIMQYLDVHSFRALPSQRIQMPQAHKDLGLLHQEHPSPDDYLQQLEQEDQAAALPLELPKQNLTVIPLLRKINLAIILLGISYGLPLVFFQIDSSKGYRILLGCLVCSFILLIWTYFRRQNSAKIYRLNIAAADAKQFWEKQKNVFKGIRDHLKIFWQQLHIEYNHLFFHDADNKQGTLQQKIALQLEELNGFLSLQDKAAQELIQTELFEYAALKDKYNRLLHTHPSFANASSLDAELAAIDFALQEAMEDLQKTLNKELRSTQLEYDQLFEKNQRILQQQERAVQKRIGQYRKHLEQARKQEEKKLLTKLRRQLQKDFAEVAPNAAIKLTLFKKEILSFLEQHKIRSMHQIKDIKPPGIVTLKYGQQVNIAPLRYYQIHELLEWWMAVTLGKVDLPKSLQDELANRYNNDFKSFKKKLKKDLSIQIKKSQKTKKVLQQEAATALKELRAKNQPQIVQIRQKYKAEKDFLSNLIDQRLAEEQAIHQAYERQFEQLIKKAAQQAQQTNLSIQQSYQAQATNTKRLSIYKKNASKYYQGLQRLKEEHQRLYQMQSRYNAIQKERSKYQDLHLGKHLLQMFFIQPLKINP